MCVCVIRYGSIISTKAILDKNTGLCRGKSVVWPGERLISLSEYAL